MFLAGLPVPLIFLTQSLGASGLVLLLLVLLFGMSGVVRLERGKVRRIDVPPLAERDPGSSTAIIVEGTLMKRSPSGEDSHTAALEEGAKGQASQDGLQEEARDLSEDEEIEAFKALVEQALAAEFQQHIHNVAVLVESEPDEQTPRSMGIRPGHLLLGCYQGAPLTAQGHSGAALPRRIILYQRSLEAYCHGDPERMPEQVRPTVLHEVAHYFGFDHEPMPNWRREVLSSFRENRHAGHTSLLRMAAGHASTI